MPYRFILVLALYATGYHAQLCNRKGNWNSDCTNCTQGFYGPTCDLKCPGGSCNPCGGHGRCSDGVDGNGKCICFQSVVTGYWEGQSCQSCSPDWGGQYCSQQCPGGCFGHGICLLSRAQSPECTCFRNTTAGFWNKTTSCKDCELGYSGARCNVREFCLTTNPGSQCSGHGTCKANNTSPTCLCTSGWYRESCDQQCPGNGTCNGHGVCSDGAFGSGQCVCSPRYAAASVCAECEYGYSGPNCSFACPLDLRGLVCSDRAPCTNGTCECPKAWVGPSCNISCDAFEPSDGTVCSNRGRCVSNGNGSACQCEGRFAGQRCEICKSGYRGELCDVECPGGLSSPCNRRGVCERLVESCRCFTGYFGVACECNVSNPVGVCALSRCADTTRYGPDCAFSCNGVGGKCSGHGSCRNLIAAVDGLCTCDGGYSGEDCSLRCPYTTSGICSGHGECSDGYNSTGKCFCLSLWTGTYCNISCPGALNGSTCSGHGSCQLAPESATCNCTSGWGGQLCDVQCPTLFPNSVCYGHGVCSANGTCSCREHYRPPSCDTCVAGWTGANCEFGCPTNKGAVCSGQGKCNNTGSCVCDEGYAGDDCSLACPRHRQVVCNGGFCTAHGACICLENSYGPACGTFCSPAQTCRSLVHAQCNQMTGLCECENGTGKSAGRWAGPQCSDCAFGFYGELCNKPCLCNNRGSCQRVTGICKCYTDDSNGYWSGYSCEKCVDGYLPPQCINAGLLSTLGSTIELLKLQDSSIQTVYVNGTIIYDVTYNALYAGGRPLHKFILGGADGDGSNVTSFSRLDLGGTHRDSFLYGPYLYVFVNGDGVCGVVLIQRSSNGTIKVVNDTELEQGTIRLPFTRVVSISAVSPSEYFVMGKRDNKDCYVLFIANPASYSPLSCFSFQVMAMQPIRGQTFTFGVKDTSLYLQIDNRTDSSVDVQSSFFNDLMSACSSRGLRCTSVVSTAADEKNGLVWIVFSTTSIQSPCILVTFSIHPALTVIRSSVVPWPSTKLLYFTIDLSSQLGFLSVIASDGTCNILIITLTTLTMSGVVKFSIFGNELELIINAFLSTEKRTMYLLTSLKRLRIQVLNVYWVTSVKPSIVDIKGGTTISVSGIGFHPKSQCRLGATAPVTATFVNSTVILCSTTRVVREGSCDGNEVAVAPQSTANRFSLSKFVVLRSVSTPSVSSVTPSFGTLGEEPTITVKGAGFVESPFIRCVLVVPFDDQQYDILKDSNNSFTDQVIVDAVSRYYFFGAVLGPDVLACRLPAFAHPTPEGTVLEVSVDGQVHSSSALPFDVFGYPVAISASPRRVITTAKVKSSIGDLRIFTADIVGHNLNADAFAMYNITTFLNDRPMFLCLIRNDFDSINPREMIGQNRRLMSNGTGDEVFIPLPTECYNSSSILTVDNGKLVPNVQAPIYVIHINSSLPLKGISLSRPLADTYTLLLGDSLTKSFSHISIDIIQGSPYQLQFVNENQAGAVLISRSGEITSSFEIILVDAGNNLILYDGLIIQTFLNPERFNYTTEDERKEASTATADPTYTSLRKGHTIVGINQSPRPLKVADAKHGVTYLFEFALGQNLDIPSLYLRASVVDCAGASTFWIKYRPADECLRCPVGGRCNGTSEVETAPGYWKPERLELDNNQTSFYKCMFPASCLGGFNSTCADHYTGPLCSVCGDGYSKEDQKSPCQKCISINDAVVQVFTRSALIVGFVVWLMVNIVSLELEEYNARTENGSWDATVFLKLMINYAQSLWLFSSLEINWETSISKFMVLFSQGTGVSLIDNEKFDMACYLRWGFFAKFALGMVTPAIALFSTAVVFYLYFQFKKAKARLGKAKVKERAITIDARVYCTFIATNLIIIHYLFPWLMKLCAFMLKCVDIDGSQYLQADMQHNCQSQEYRTWLIIALLFMLLYSIVLFGTWGGTLFRLSRIRHGKALWCNSKTWLKFSFAYRGYKHRHWYWELVIFFRKLVIAFITVFLSNEVGLQVFLFRWIICISIFLNYIVEPWVHPFHNTLENATLYSMYILLEGTYLVLAFESLGTDRFNWMTSTISLLVLIMNFSLIVVFIFLLGNTFVRWLEHTAVEYPILMPLAKLLVKIRELVTAQLKRLMNMIGTQRMASENDDHGLATTDATADAAADLCVGF